MSSIRVNIYDLPAKAAVEVNLPTDEDMTCSAVCTILAEQTNLSTEECHLILVVFSSTLASSGRSGSSLYTLKDDDLVLNTLESMNKKVAKRWSKGRVSKFTHRWYYKYRRSLLLDIGDAGDLSGASSSDEGEELSYDNYTYIRQGDRKGYFYKKSKKDPTLWRRRYCVLTDRLWCIAPHKNPPKGFSIPLISNVLVEDRSSEFYAPFLVVVHAGLKTYTFRASSTSEQENWISDLNLRTTISIDNDAIDMAEMLICDEEGSLSARMQAACAPFFECAVVKDFLSKEDSKSPNKQSGAARPETVSSATSRTLIKTSSSTSAMVIEEKSPSSSPSPLLQLMPSRTPPSALSLPPGVRESPRSQQNVHRCADRQVLHAMHTERPRMAAAWGFCRAVQRYKELHRDENCVTAKQLWIAAMRVYKEYIAQTLPPSSSRGHGHGNATDTTGSSTLPIGLSVDEALVLLDQIGYVVDDEDEGHTEGTWRERYSVDIAEGLNSGNSNSVSLSLDIRDSSLYGDDDDDDERIWMLSSTNLKRLKDAVFSNVRKRVRLSAPTKQQQQAQSSTTATMSNLAARSWSLGSMFWYSESLPENAAGASLSVFSSPSMLLSSSSISSSDTGAGADGDPAVLAAQSDSVYQFVDLRVRPSASVFDEVLLEVQGNMAKLSVPQRTLQQHLRRRRRRTISTDKQTQSSFVDGRNGHEMLNDRLHQNIS